MKIQITDRELWLAKVNNAIQNINNERAKILAEYLAQPWYRQLFNIYDEEWSQMYAWCDMGVLRRVKVALESEGTGEICIDAGELMLIQ